MSKFEDTFRRLFPSDIVALHYAAEMLYLYSATYTTPGAFPAGDERAVITRAVIKGLVTDKARSAQWVTYLRELCNDTAKILVLNDTFKTTEDFYATFSKPLVTGESDPELMEKIFETMEQVLKEKYSKILLDVFLNKSPA